MANENSTKIVELESDKLFEMLFNCAQPTPETELMRISRPALRGIFRLLTQGSVLDNRDKDLSVSPEFLQELRHIVQEVYNNRHLQLKLPLNINLVRRVDSLKLPVQIRDALRWNNTVFIGDLVQNSEEKILNIPNIGPQMLKKINEILDQLGLHLGMDIPSWPPENLFGLTELLEKQNNGEIDDDEISLKLILEDRSDIQISGSKPFKYQ